MRQQPLREFTIVDMARAFNVAAHTAINQKRKYTGEDYYHHPEEVLQILLTYTDPTKEEQAAALLHDVIEDTSVVREHIARVFGQVVANLVVEVSDVSKPHDGNRKVRKALDRAHLNRGSIQSKRLKCADLMSNSKSITAHDPKFAEVYLAEEIDILDDFYGEMHGEWIYQETVALAGQAFLKLYPESTKRHGVLTKLLKGKKADFIELLWKE